MKPLFRALALIAVLGFACLPASGSGPAVGCQYLCGSTIHQTISTSCCTQTFTCPNGQKVPGFKVYSTPVGGYIYCP
jgi:hypothetical protein